MTPGRWGQAVGVSSTIFSYFDRALPRTSPHIPQSDTRTRNCITCVHFPGPPLAEHMVCEHRRETWVISRATDGCAFWGGCLEGMASSSLAKRRYADNAV